MANQNGELSESERSRIASDFICHAPPGEFNEVFNDVRLLLRGDQLLKDQCAWAFAHYNKEQQLPVKVNGSDKLTLISNFNDLGDGQFYDPRSQQSFHYDHLRKEGTDFKSHAIPEPKAEPWRLALQNATDKYMENHFTRTGVGAVFGRFDTQAEAPALTLCIESHQFQPKNYWNGRWRSQWSIVLTDKVGELKGTIKVQVHYYEDGNVQLVSSKDITKKVTVTNPESTAKAIIALIEEEETNYQVAVDENYTQMSDSTFKALRRALPVTRTKIDWMKIHSYRICSELKPV